jgi:hypothetical protein
MKIKMALYSKGFGYIVPYVDVALMSHELPFNCTRHAPKKKPV